MVEGKVESCVEWQGPASPNKKLESTVESEVERQGPASPNKKVKGNKADPLQDRTGCYIVTTEWGKVWRPCKTCNSSLISSCKFCRC